MNKLDTGFLDAIDAGMVGKKGMNHRHGGRRHGNEERDEIVPCEGTPFGSGLYGSDAIGARTFE